MNFGCCVDNECTKETCMSLPKGKSCGDCVYIERCQDLFGHVPTDTNCSFFPRRFRQKVHKSDLDKLLYTPEEARAFGAGTKTHYRKPIKV